MAPFACADLSVAICAVNVHVSSTAAANSHLSVLSNIIQHLQRLWLAVCLKHQDSHMWLESGTAVLLC